MADDDTPATILGPDGLERQVCISRNSGDVFAEDVEFDGLTLTVEIADEAEGRAFLAAISAAVRVHGMTRAEKAEAEVAEQRETIRKLRESRLEALAKEGGLQMALEEAQAEVAKLKAAKEVRP